MNRTLSLILLVAGIVLVAFGVSASESLGSEISEFFTGRPTDKAIWLLIGGAALSVVGLWGMNRGRSTP
jgi:hypothetical protein